MSPSGPPLARSQLRLATPPTESHRADRRAWLLLRAVIAWFAIAWRTGAAIIGAAFALAPLAWRRAPLGRRVHPVAARQARVIPFQPRRQVQHAMRR